MVPICRVPLITSQREEQALITGNNMKPVVKLLINRHNNKYSYTGASDDNLLKNIELFDKLSLRFSNRVLFIKDVIGSNEICCWSFYGHGKKIAEVCCTAIVYATDRKNTKVEFPEARIYEETLNCLLYENRTGPDQDLMQVHLHTYLAGMQCHYLSRRLPPGERGLPTPVMTRTRGTGLGGRRGDSQIILDIFCALSGECFVSNPFHYSVCQ